LFNTGLKTSVTRIRKAPPATYETRTANKPAGTPARNEDDRRAVIEAPIGAPDHTDGGWLGPPLRMAVEYGSAEVVAELAARVDDVDAVSDGRTALWAAVAANRPDNARALVAAGADPWQEMMSGWPPGRLSLASPTPGLLGSEAPLSQEEIAAVAESRRLITVVGGADVEGLGIACVADIDVGEAVHRLAAEVVDGDGEKMMALWRADPLDFDILTMWVPVCLVGV
jgi:hypothetical protein